MLAKAGFQSDVTSQSLRIADVFMTAKLTPRVSALRQRFLSQSFLSGAFGLAVLVTSIVFAGAALADDKAEKAEKRIASPALKAVDTKGKKVDLAKLKGKVVLIDFWATWCPPCLKEIPNLEKIHQALHEKGFVIIGVANNDKETLQDHFKKQPMPWSTIADDENVVSESFEVDSWPTTLLINAKGEHIASNLHAGKLLDKVIAELKLEPSSYQALRDEFKKAHDESHAKDEDK